MPIDKDGVMIILSSPSGAGKTTLVNLLSKLNNFETSISHTTRQPRPNEIKDKDKVINLLKESLGKIWPNSKISTYRLDQKDKEIIKRFAINKFKK